MAKCCGNNTKFDGLSVVEMTAGHLAKSQALQADALDFFSDALTYGISLAVIGSSIQVRTNAALAKGVSLFLIGLYFLCVIKMEMQMSDRFGYAHVMMLLEM